MTNKKAQIVIGNIPIKPEVLDDCYDITEYQEAKAMAIKALDQRWIPVSERSPEKSGDYLVTTEWIGSYSGDTYRETNMAAYRRQTKEWDCTDVIAWMPKPQPYKVDGE